MELANNTWNKGLLMDTHPMMLGNDSMTDCLNGTLISMNGNEVILQNDMGNRRIDHAFLPSGYEPVGIKEHGGVIYVASYNPITNKSLIGSFPSPERVIDINDDKNLKNSFDFDSFFIFKENGNILNDSTLNIPVMISDSFLIPLTPKNKLHVGDIFTVYSPHLSSLAPDLTNYDNILYYSKWKKCTKQEYDEITDSNLKKEEIIELQSTYYKRSLIDKVYSPKNRKYTLLLGILNEQNNFNDITSSLVRWNSPLKEVTKEEYDEYKTTKEIRYYVYEDNVWKEVTKEDYDSFEGSKQVKYFIYVPQKIIRNLENKSQLYKFNTGYFIPDGFTPNKDIDGEPIDDANLIKSRKQIAANNFSYKLAGPLYLKVSYNHVHSFGYAINGTWDDKNKKATLKITGYFTYNCPDGVNTINDNGDSDYFTYELGTPTAILFDFFNNNGNTPLKIKPDPNTTSTSTCIYNKTTNLYTVTLTKEYTINYLKDIYNYVIGVLGGKYNNDNNIFYIKDLSSIGQINLRLLNSGAITLKLYKFYNKAETHDTTMTLEFETYPKEGLTFEDMYLKFENILNVGEPKRYLALHLPILNGKLVFSFNWLDSISNDTEGTEYDENVPYELANIKLKARQTYKVTIHYKDINTLLNLEINSTYDDGIDRWLLTTELFNDLYSSNLTDYCNKALTNGNLLFLEKLTIAPNSKLVGSLYKVKYGDVTYYNPTYSNDNKAPMYSVLNGDSLSRNIITLYQPVEFKKLASTQLLDVSNYPDYIEDITLNISGADDNELLLEEITANDYLALQYVYNPLRTVLLLKDRINASFAGYTRAWDAGTDEGAEIIYFYKRSYEEVLLAAGSGHTPAELNPQGIGFTNGWRDSGGEDCWLNRNITNYLDLSDISGIDFAVYKGLFFPSVFCLTYAGSDALGWASYIGGPYFAVNRNTSNDEDIVFVKASPYLALSDKLINWNEEYATESVYKILGNSPTLQLKIKSITYSIYLTINARIDEDENYILPYIGNLKFTVDTRTIPNTLDLLYDNGSIVDEYRRYKNKTLDKYIDLNTGNKILDIKQDLYSTNRLFKIEQYKTIKYLGKFIFDKLSYCDDDEGLAFIRGYYSPTSNAKELNFINAYPLTTYDTTTETDIPIEHPNIIGYTFSTDILYKIDNGSWTNLPANKEVKVGYNDPKTPGGVKVKLIIYWRKNVDIGNYDNNGVGTFTSKEYVYNAESTAETEIGKYEYHGDAGKFVAYDNILSIIYGENFEVKTTCIDYAFKNLFKNCSGLINAAGISLQFDLAIGCFWSMFENCTSITESPILPASRFKVYCYIRMFNGCTNLSKVTCLASDLVNSLYTNATMDWLENVANSGEFTQKARYTLWETGKSGIPNGWTKTEV